MSAQHNSGGHFCALISHPILSQAKKKILCNFVNLTTCPSPTFVNLAHLEHIHGSNEQQDETR